jgi:hypothetical protein
VVHLIPQNAYDGLSGNHEYFAATTDLARLMATYPDWLAREELWQTAVKKVERLRQAVGEWEAKLAHETSPEKAEEMRRLIQLFQQRMRELNQGRY